MKILYVLNSGNIGGMELHVLDLVKSVVSKENDVYVWCGKGEMVSKYSKSGASVSIEPIDSDIDIAYIKKLKKFLVDKKIDIIHSHEIKAVVNAAVAAFLAKTKIKISHSHTPISHWKIGNIKKAINTLVYGTVVNLFSTCEIALTETIKKAKQREGIFKKKLKVIPNGIDVLKLEATDEQKKQYREEIRRRYNIPENSFVVGLVGRYSKEKGQDLLIKAFKEFYDIVGSKNVYLLLAGGGIEEKSLKKLAESLNINERVIFTGVFVQENLIKIYSAIDLFVFPSYAEGFGLVLIEAMYCKLPIVCSNINVLREVGGENLFYFQSGNIQSLVNKMNEVYSIVKEGKYSQGNMLKDRVEENYTFKKFAENYKVLYENLLKETKK